jgi:leucyl aminopeptidase (aminopeptidase T)
MGRGEANTIENVSLMPRAMRNKSPASVQNEFSGFSREESIAYAENILLQSGVGEDEEIIIRLGDEEQAAAVPSFMEAAARLGLRPPRILPHDHVLSDEEVLDFLSEQEEQLLGGGVSISLSSLPGGTAFTPHPEFFDWINSEYPDRQSRVREQIRDLTDRSNIENLRRWNVSIWPNKEWASLVFPESSDPEKEMANLLMKATYTSDPEGLARHIEELEKRKEYIDDLLQEGYNQVRIETPREEGLDHPLNRGTDLRMTIADESHFASVKLDNSQGDSMTLNNPTDEVYGTPIRSSVTGHFTSTRPYITQDHEGNTIIIPGVYGEFENGKLVRIESFDSEYNEYLERDFQSNTDPPTDILGELGLVDSSGALAQAKDPNGNPRTFFNNILDENTGVHIGFGKSYLPYTGGVGDIAPASGTAHRDIVIGNEKTRVSFLNDAGDERRAIDGGLWHYG